MQVNTNTQLLQALGSKKSTNALEGLNSDPSSDLLALLNSELPSESFSEQLELLQQHSQKLPTAINTEKLLASENEPQLKKLDQLSMATKNIENNGQKNDIDKLLLNKSNEKIVNVNTDLVEKDLKILNPDNRANLSTEQLKLETKFINSQNENLVAFDNKILNRQNEKLASKNILSSNLDQSENKLKLNSELLMPNENTAQIEESVVKELPFKNSEQASKQFVPERKSIFDITKKNQEVVDLNSLVKPSQKNETFLKQEIIKNDSLVKNPYQSSMDSSLFKKDLETKLANTHRTRPDNNIMEFMLEQDVKAMDRHIQMPSNSSSNLDLGGQSIAKGAAVFELSNLTSSNDQSAVIDQIQNYIIQSKASNEPKVQMSFHHQDLGVIDLEVQKADLGKISISITTNTNEGLKFFNQHQNDLLGSLSSSGIKVSEFKLDSNSQSDFSQNSGQNNSQQFGQSSDRNQDSKRREELWNLFKQHRDAA